MSGSITISEIVTDEILIHTIQDALDLMASAPSSYLVLYKHNFEENFFDLKTGVAGEILQKFTNYRVNLAILGNFDKYDSKALKDFIYESNKRRNYLFVSSLDEVKKIWNK